MKSLLVISVFVAISMVGHVREVSPQAQRDKVLCCWYCTACDEQKCEMADRVQCERDKGTVVLSCDQCSAGEKQK
ncbi:MAG: hypothetical protein FJ118_03970 [Deltaproteobacteria bacterium]|nr:hypothetical protein [Deltaproteobacteria bacterium]